MKTDNKIPQNIISSVGNVCMYMSQPPEGATTQK